MKIEIVNYDFHGEFNLKKPMFMSAKLLKLIT
ncbi:hypothetical protein MATR_07460 [Marivirga tractuosa]|uniref:Uncharacterized protein n=1 Tax=Marivirga tractuosa (strain ATCC 23168 / DSM 4126 / NBRC 15989 / NCIMB 1408 / VKM B-1430 / H-43) TaxID=643867 RepID=E4TQ77_MARTH|nr:hypothetical protein Ftrac_1634 [Marivirga tractuosa DSM 4126]BDD13921.1 hypothetical protein MATR_07460 [Marivirga tractuosa]